MTAKGSCCCCSMCGVQLPPEANGCCLCVCDSICVKVRNLEVGGNCDCEEYTVRIPWDHDACAYVGTVGCGSLSIDVKFDVKKCSDGTCRLCLTSTCLGLTGQCGNAGCKEFSPGHNGDCGKYLKDCDQSGGWDETWNVDASGCGSSTCPSIEINVTCYPRVNPAGGGMSRLCKDCDCVCECVTITYQETSCIQTDSVSACWDGSFTATLDLDNDPVTPCTGAQQTVTMLLVRDDTTGCCNWEVTITRGVFAEGYPGAGTTTALIKTECPEVSVSLGVELPESASGIIEISCLNCVISLCCDRLDPPGITPLHLPTTLTLTISNVTDCGCVDGLTVELTWDSMANIWSGTGPGGGACALLSEEWRLSCSRNPAAPPGSCQNLQLSIGGVTACIIAPAFPQVGCYCDPIRLDYSLIVSGIGCCDGSMDGSGTITVTVTE